MSFLHIGGILSYRSASWGAPDSFLAGRYHQPSRGLHRRYRIDATRGTFSGRLWPRQHSWMPPLFIFLDPAQTPTWAAFRMVRSRSTCQPLMWHVRLQRRGRAGSEAAGDFNNRIGRVSGDHGRCRLSGPAHFRTGVRRSAPATEFSEAPRLNRSKRSGALGSAGARAARRR